MPYIHGPKDQDVVSLICRRWYKLDAPMPKHIAIALYYTTTPDRLRSHFGYLESLKLNGKPYVQYISGGLGRLCGNFLVISVLKVLALSAHDRQ
ncbi:hypothetical protein PanWU01x14_222580 [Parasponia andersonii]|uniref:COI1 F-box domain-containing protein n=1 Tax=Parasponia andersonii TaxID=3476 RepID=A0A2P5BP49_PARAD|nr:hypothetical protein PanWU01x14_222580 [Parasponia andersonii]